MSAVGQPAHPKYRPDIDGLRAVAVLPVVAFHAAPQVLSGGFVGVDIFFVISGFLISGIIFQNLDRGTFSFGEFYSRRIKRIFPALILVLCTCLTVGWFKLFSNEYQQLGKHVAAGAGFVSNLALWTEAGYFDNAAETKPLLHLWSLGIEEQFYIVWPLLLWIVSRFSRTRWVMLVILAAIGATSFYLNVTNIRHDPVATFYLPQTRFWELLSGSLLAWVALSGRLDIIARDRTVANSLSFGGALILVLSFVLVRATHFPGYWAVLPVAGSAMLIAAGPNAWFNRICLSNKVAVAIGLISYPLYVWHWPLLVYGRIEDGKLPSLEFRLLAVAAAFVLATMTYLFIEKNLRYRGRGTAVALFAVMAIVGTAGYTVYINDGVRDRSIARLGEEVTAARKDWKYHETRFVDGKIVDLNYLSGREKESVLFIGSSLMGEYYPRAHLIYSQNPKPRLSAIYASRNHCTPIPTYDFISAPENINCKDYYTAALKLADDPSVVKVVFGADWPRFYTGDQLSDAGKLFVRDLQALVNSGKAVFLIGNSPMDSRFDPMAIGARIRKSLSSKLPDWFISRPEAEDEESMADLGRVARLAGATLINPLDSLCEPRGCPVIQGGKMMYTDRSHIRAEYAAKSATFIDQLVEK